MKTATLALKPKHVTTLRNNLHLDLKSNKIKKPENLSTPATKEKYSP
jgi:hypothetical protein